MYEELPHGQCELVFIPLLMRATIAAKEIQRGVREKRQGTERRGKAYSIRIRLNTLTKVEKRGLSEGKKAKADSRTCRLISRTPSTAHVHSHHFQSLGIGKNKCATRGEELGTGSLERVVGPRGKQGRKTRRYPSRCSRTHPWKKKSKFEQRECATMQKSQLFYQGQWQRKCAVRREARQGAETHHREESGRFCLHSGLYRPSVRRGDGTRASFIL